MKLMTLLENTGSGNTSLHHEHGLSVFLECGTKRYIFDFGPTEKSLENARRLGVPVEKADFLIGSHGHYDHSGGYPAFVAAGCRQPLVTGAGYFRRKYSVEGIKCTYLGNSFDEAFLKAHGIEHRVCRDVLALSETEFIVSGFTRRCEFEAPPERFVLRDGDRFVRDDFSDEVCFVHKLKDGLFVLVGCSHPGILNILSSVQERFRMPVIGVVGGTHLMEASEERIRRTLAIVKGLGLRFVGFNHCSGALFQKIVEQDPDINAVHLGTGQGLFL